MQNKTRDQVLALIAKGPIRYMEIVGDTTKKPDKDARKVVHTIIKQLREEGAIKVVSMDRLPYYVLAAWKMTDEELLAHVRRKSVRTVDGCLLWSEKTCPDRGPMGLGRINLRRAIWEIKRGPLGFSDSIKVQCERWNCVSYECMEKTTRSKITTGLKKRPLHALRIAQAAQRVLGKVGWDEVRAIRASEESGPVLAERYGIAKQTVSQIRNGKTWKEPTVGGLFTGLMQAPKKAA